MAKMGAVCDGRRRRSEDGHSVAHEIVSVDALTRLPVSKHLNLTGIRVGLRVGLTLHRPWLTRGCAQACAQGQLSPERLHGRGTGWHKERLKAVSAVMLVVVGGGATPRPGEDGTRGDSLRFRHLAIVVDTVLKW